MSEAEYLALETADATRYEYLGDRARAMAGASLRHNEVCLSLASILRSSAAGTGCRVFMENARLRVNSQRYYYPDVMVTCTEQEENSPTACQAMELRSRPSRFRSVLNRVNRFWLPGHHLAI